MSKIGLISKAILDHYPNGFFSLDQIVQLTKFSRKYLADALIVLSKEGVVRKIGKHRREHIPGHSPKFSLVYIANKKALAARIAPKLKKETVQDRMWLVIRGKRFFTVRDLIIIAGAKRGMARWYLKALRGLGIIEPSRTGGGVGVEWKLMSDPGVKRPYIKGNRKPNDRGINNKENSKMGTAKRDRRINIWLSKADIEFIKKEASKLNLSRSAYIRMLVFKKLGFDERTARAKACDPSL